jgi:hypothetical protein
MSIYQGSAATQSFPTQESLLPWLDHLRSKLWKNPVFTLYLCRPTSPRD